MALRIDGTAMAGVLSQSVAEDVKTYLGQTGVRPTLAVVLMGDDPASEVYVRRKLAACVAVGIASQQHRLPAECLEPDLIALIDALNADPSVHGILVQLPLPAGLNASVVLDRIDAAKDVDGFHPVNVGRLSVGTKGLVPCTPLGCMMLLDSVIDDYKGLHAVVIGKSNIVGKPVALLLLERECTVVVTHIFTKSLADLIRSADIVVAAAGSPRLVRGDWIKPGAVVIDVGINRVTAEGGGTRLVGDCAGDELGHAHAYTPVPGGVGPMTVGCLMSNTMRAARSQLRAL